GDVPAPGDQRRPDPLRRLAAPLRVVADPAPASGRMSPAWASPRRRLPAGATAKAASNVLNVIRERASTQGPTSVVLQRRRTAAGARGTPGEFRTAPRGV